MASSKSHRTDDTAELLKDIQNRIEKLERVVLPKSRQASAKGGADSFSGATGGIRFLISKGFFDRKRAFGEIKKALADNGYHYSKQAVQTPLNALSRPGSLLVSFREGGRKVYAKRK
jgi:hypothetical protein